MRKTKPGRHLTTRLVFTITLFVIGLTIISVWLFGLGNHRSLYNNSLLSTTILSICFFGFLTFGLYRGLKLKDNVGKLTDQINLSKLPDFSGAGDMTNFSGLADDIGSAIASLLLWILATVLIAIFLWLFSVLLWTGVIVFIAMLYWIFFRAVRLVFKKSNQCRGHLALSIQYAMLYTILYNIWIYAIIMIAHVISS